MTESVLKFFIPIFGITVTIITSLLITILTLIWNVNSEVKTNSAMSSMILNDLHTTRGEQITRGPSIHTHKRNGEPVYMYGGDK